MICSFLLFLFNKGYSSSSLNIARSSISFFSLDLFNLSDDPVITRLFKYFYNVRPLRPKYFTYWPVSKLLNFLAEWHPSDTLTMKQLTIKTVALIALTSSDRGQTLHLMNIKNCTQTESKFTFVIFDKLKHSRKTAKPKVIECSTFDIPSLDVSHYVSEYMKRTEPWREDIKDNPRSKQLFLSWASRKPVTKQSIARWLRSALDLSGIDSSQFAAHSYRGAGLSAAHNKGASIETIIKQGEWKNVNCFRKFYSAPSQDSTVGQIILSHFENGE